MVPLKAAIFDMDGTVFDTQGPQYGFHKYCAETWGTHDPTHNPFPKNNRTFWKKYNKAYKEGGLKKLYGRYGLDWDVCEGAITRAYVGWNEEHTAEPFTFDGYSTADAIQEIFMRGSPSRQRRTRLRIGISTTKEEDALDPLLEKAGIEHCIDSKVTRDDVVRHCASMAGIENASIYDMSYLMGVVPSEVAKHMEKPNGMATMLSLLRLGSNAGNTIVFEDTTVGIHACKNVLMPDATLADVYVVGVNWGFEDEKTLLAAGANQIINHPKQMVDIIEERGGFL